MSNCCVKTISCCRGPRGQTGPQGVAGQTGPQGEAGQTGPQGAAGAQSDCCLQVFDNNGNLLGNFVGFFDNGVLVFRNGYYIRILFSGKFDVAQTWWTGANCGDGTGYLNDGNGGNPGIVRGANVIVYSGARNSLMIPVNPGGDSSVVSTGPHAATFIENAGLGSPTFARPDGSFQCDAVSTNVSGWELQDFDGATELGWTLFGTPLQVAGPIIVQ